MCSLELPRWGGSNEYTQHTKFMINKKISLNIWFSGAIGRILQGLKNEFELAIVNEPSVFELLWFDCSFLPIRFFKRKQINPNGSKCFPFIIDPFTE